MRTTIFLHGEKDSNYRKGRELGLDEDALRTFLYACYEVRVELEVNAATGEAEIAKVDGKDVVALDALLERIATEIEERQFDDDFEGIAAFAAQVVRRVRELKPPKE